MTVLAKDNDLAPRQDWGRLPFIDGLRAVAALFVVLDHIYFEVFGPGSSHSPPPALKFLSSTMTLGHLSVTIFIVISGFVLTLPIIKYGMRLGPAGPRGFLARRSRRILPAYYAALILTLLLLQTVLRYPTYSHFDSVRAVRAPDIVSHLLLLQNVFGAGKINYVFWSIATECHIYLLFPLLLILWSRWGPGWTLASAMAAGYAVQFGFAGQRIARANVHFLGLFVMGMFAAAYLLPRISSGRRGPLVAVRVLAAISLALVATLLYVLRSQPMLPWFPVFDLPTGIIAVWVLVEGAARQGRVARAFGSRPLVSIGLFSYSLYLLHMPMIVALLYLSHGLGLAPTATFAFLCTIGTALILAGSYAFYCLFERPFLTTSARSANSTAR